MTPTHTPLRWPLVLIAAPAAVAVWSGWVGLGGMAGFGVIHPLPGIAPGFELNTAITLPVGVETYGAYALGAWLGPSQVPDAARTFARRSAIGALALGMLGQVVYHLLAAAHATRAPWPAVVAVSCMPVVTLGFGAALTHLLREHRQEAPAVVAVADSAPVAVTETAMVPVTAPTAEPTTEATEAPTSEPTEPPSTVRQVSRHGAAKKRDRNVARAARLLSANPDWRARELAAKLSVSERTAERYMAEIASGTTAPLLASVK